MYFYRNKDRMQINYTWNKFLKNNKTEHKSISKDKITESIRFEFYDKQENNILFIRVRSNLSIFITLSITKIIDVTIIEIIQFLFAFHSK